MFERSEFSRRFEPREAQGTAVATGRSGTRPGEKHFWFLLVRQKEPARVACGSSYLPSIRQANLTTLIRHADLRDKFIDSATISGHLA